MKNAEIILTSDGSGSAPLSGAGVCILERKDPPFRMKLAAFLGACTGNEAELMAGLLGLLALGELAAQEEWEFGTRVIWQTDSQYIVRSLARPEPENAGNRPNSRIWRAIGECTKRFSINPSHVRARSGNRRNEACDHAARWIQRAGKKLLDEFGEGKIGRLRETSPREAWFLIDLSGLLETLRGEKNGGEDGSLTPIRSRLGAYLREF